MNIAVSLSESCGWASCLFALTFVIPCFGQELPTAKPEDVDVSSTKVEELSTFMQSFVDDGKIAGGVTMMARHGKVIHLKAVGMSAYLLVDNNLRKVQPGETLKHHLWGGPITISSDYVYDKSNIYLSGGGSLCSTPSDFMRFCQMLLNGRTLNGVRLLREETVRLMTTNQLGDLPGLYGFGFGITPESEDVHQQLRGMYNGGGYWSTTFAVSPRGDWVLVTMSQLGYDEKLTPAWSTQYENMAAAAIEK